MRYLDGGGRAAASAQRRLVSRAGPRRDPVSRHPARHADHARRGGQLDRSAAVNTAGCRCSAISKPPSATRAKAYAVGERLAGWIEASAAELAPHPEAAAIFLPQGRAPRAGSKLVNPNLARTLAALAESGLVRFLRRRGGARDGALRRCQRRLLHAGRPQARTPAGASRCKAAIATSRFSRRRRRPRASRCSKC